MDRWMDGSARAGLRGGWSLRAFSDGGVQRDGTDLYMAWDGELALPACGDCPSMPAGRRVE